MPMFDLNSDERDDDHIRWTAGGESDVAVLVNGKKVYQGEIGKGQDVIIAYADATDGDAK